MLLLRPIIRNHVHAVALPQDNVDNVETATNDSHNHRLRASGSTVVTMTSKVNGKTEILTPCRSETPKNIEAKLRVIDYVMDPYNLANFCGNLSKGVCSPYWWNITYSWLCVPFLSFPFFLVVAYSKNGWTDFHDVYLKWRGFAQGCAFWGSLWRKIML